MTHKYCPGCGNTKPHADFAKHKNRPDGLSGWCKACLRANKRRWTENKQTKEFANALA